MTSLLIFLLTPTALAQDECPISPGAYEARVRDAREQVAFAEPTVEGELSQLELLLVACVDGPVSRDTLVRLLLAQGAFEVLREGGDAEKAQRYLSWAASLGGEAAWDDTYGPDVEKVFRAAAKKTPPPATLDLSFAEEVQVVSVDGDVTYDYGLMEVPAGRHVVQWSTDDGWRAEVVDVAAGEQRVVGGGVPTALPVEPLLDENGQPIPPEGEGEEDDWREPLGTFSFFLGGGVDRVSGRSHYGGTAGDVSATLPNLSLEAWYKGLGWWVGLDGTYTGAAPDTGMVMPRSFAFSGGVALGERVATRFGVGLTGTNLALPLVTAAQSNELVGWAPPTFENPMSFGGRALLELTAGDKVQGRARAEASLLSGGVTASGGAGVGVSLGPVRPTLSAEYGWLSRRGVDDDSVLVPEALSSYDRDTYNWIRVEAGLWYAF